MKMCKVCGKSLSLSQFKYADGYLIDYPDRRTKICKTCLRIRRKGKRRNTRAQPDWLLNALIRDNYRCRDCSTTEGMLVVHHLDESRRLGEDKMNNNLDNLLTLCKPCHAVRHHLTKRHEDIRKLREVGLSFQEIGNRKSITRQRAHQLYRRDVASQELR